MIAERAEREMALRRFLADNYPLGGDMDALGGDTSLLEAGVIDSTGVLELIAYIEETFDLQVPDEDLLPENFDSVDNILDYLARRQPA